VKHVKLHVQLMKLYVQLMKIHARACGTINHGTDSRIIVEPDECER